MGSVVENGLQYPSGTEASSPSIGQAGKEQVKRLGGVTKERVYQRLEHRKGDVTSVLSRIADSLEKAIEQDKDGGPAPRIVRGLAGYVRNFSRSIESGSPEELVQKAQSSFRERPGLYLVGLAAAGFFAARMLRS